MLDQKSAYEILGVREGASKDEIAKRYNILLKRYRAEKLEAPDGTDLKTNFDDVNKAYNMLMGYGSDEPVNPEPDNSLSAKVLRKAGIDDKKAKNFIYYYKFHFLATILAILVVGYAVLSIINRVEPDINIVVAGKFYIEDVEKLEADTTNNLPQIKEPDIQVIGLSGDTKSEMDVAMQTKFVTLMAAGDIDILILDKDKYNQFAPQGALVNLDDIAKELGIDMEKNETLVVKNGETGEAHLYGVNVTESSFLRDLQSGNEVKIAAIRLGAKNRDNAVEFLKLLLK